ncbi:transglutaminase TgpA family protein [Deinococcus maricopensis]|uniref:Transglutaminase domain-containing protein n=1 Tax=Deinococcus maricopensis (strain DSM 21211 / LMG 22137 / NRRL B-23946 / LB-34) TaxID=709986 RepID=E8U6E1_DEIML|nr:DUF3488 and transglutaminase-like domain-containing protein [Deinococcus maricopensis]ADV66630.1 transglutaminase domain-containing protein [Deinococcus maricopensis DSM 21211]
MTRVFGVQLSPTPTPEALPRVPALLTVAALTLAFAPYVVRFPFLLILAVVGAAGARAYGLWRGGRPPASWVPLALVVPFVALAVTSYGTLLGRDGGTALLVLLAALKLLESRTRRDFRMLTLVGYFLICANFFFSQGALATAYATLVTLALTASAATWGPRAPAPPAALRAATRVTLLALPVAAALFFLFPRPNGPLWTLPIQSNESRTGLPDRIAPGNVTSLAQDGSVAFRAAFQGTRPPDSALYWRGPVFDVFDGVAWNYGPQRGGLVRLQPSGQLTRYTVTLEPQRNGWLPTLAFPTNTPTSSVLTGRAQLFDVTNVEGRHAFTLESDLDARLGIQEEAGWLQFSTQLPPNVNPRARALAARWANLPPDGRVQAALAFLANGGFRYTLNPPALPERDGLDALLFGTKQGFCEHYASAFAFLMRAAGVPARVVGGYLGGQLNPTGGYLIVRNADAHAWVEVWLQGRGWTRVDPTSVVSPARVTRGLAASLTDPNDAPAISRQSSPFAQARLRLDVLEATWNTWVVSFDAARQRTLLSNLGLGRVGDARYGVALLGVVAVLLGGPLLLAARRRARPRDPALRAFAEFVARVRLRPEVGEAPGDFARRAARMHPDSADAILAVADAFARVRYGPAPTPADLRALRDRVRLVRIRG